MNPVLGTLGSVTCNSDIVILLLITIPVVFNQIAAWFTFVWVVWLALEQLYGNKMICICIQCASSYILYLVLILYIYIYIRIIVIYVYTYLYLLCNTFEIRDSFSLKMQRQGIFQPTVRSRLQQFWLLEAGAMWIVYSQSVKGCIHAQ